MATMTTPSRGRSTASSRRRVMRGSPSMAWVASRENSSRSTARAPPAGTAHWAAHPSSRDPSRRISSFKSPAALFTRAAFRELEQISSARSPLLWAGENRWGFISYKVTGIPAGPGPGRLAARQARPQHSDLFQRFLLLVYSCQPSGSFPSKVQPGVTQYRRLSFVFFCIKVLPHTGHFSLLGGSQETKSHLGYSLQP